MKRLVCEDSNGTELFSFEFEEDIKIQKYNNCEISDIELDAGVTVIRIQQLD